jgi:hypothetical protein
MADALHWTVAPMGCGLNTLLARLVITGGRFTLIMEKDAIS